MYRFSVSLNLILFLVREKRARITQFYCMMGNSELKLGVNAEVVFFLRSLEQALELIKQIERNLPLALVLSLQL